MEYWNGGILMVRNPIIPIFHYSNIPGFYSSIPPVLT
jgi:hypothetical protein